MNQFSLEERLNTYNRVGPQPQPTPLLPIVALGIIGLLLVALLSLFLSALLAKKPSIVWTAVKSQQELVLGPDSTVNFQFRLYKIDPATVQAINGVLPVRPLDSSNTSFSLSYDELAPELQKDTTALVAVRGTGVVQKILFSGLAGNGKTYKTEVPVRILGAGLPPSPPSCYAIDVKGSLKVNESLRLSAQLTKNDCPTLNQVKWVINNSPLPVKALTVAHIPKKAGALTIALQTLQGEELDKKVIVIEGTGPPPPPSCDAYSIEIAGSRKVNENLRLRAQPSTNDCTPLSQVEWVISGSQLSAKTLTATYTPTKAGTLTITLQTLQGKILGKERIDIIPEGDTPCTYALDIPKDKSLEIGRTYQYTAAQQNSGNCTEPDNAAFRWNVNNQFVAEGKVFRFSPNQSGTQTIELQLAGSRIGMQEVFVQYGIQYATQILDDYRKLLGDNPTDAEQNNFKAQIYAMAKSKNIYVVIDGVSKTLESYLRGVDGAIQAGYEDKIIQIYTDKSTGKIARLEIARSF